MGESTRGFPPLAEPTERSEVVAMVGTKWVLIDGSGSRRVEGDTPHKF